ncbi:MAG: DUF373 family protein [Desulfurococcales archaeon]|nr:DUF373 family protein [Desulfurococcales archaeon]
MPRKQSRKEKTSNEYYKPVIVVVDIDDDLGEVLGRSLVKGYEEVKSAVLEYGMKRPTDPDVNALLAGLNLYDKLRSEGRDPEIIAVGGHRIDFLEAQKNIKRLVEGAIKDIEGKPEFYIVSDGEDEFVISQLLQEYGRIGGFERVVVEQDLGIEGRYLLILKYIKKAMFDPRFSRYLLGIPGLAVTVFALLSIAGLASLALKVSALVIGLAMAIRGFNLEESLEAAISSFLLSIKERSYLQITGLIILFLALFVASYTGYVAIKETESLTIKVARIFQTSIPLLGAGIASYIFISKIFYKLTYEEQGILKDVSALIVVIAMSAAFYNLGIYIDKVNPAVFTVSLFVESGFIQFIIAGTGIAAIIEMIRRIYSTKEEESSDQSSSVAEQTSQEPGQHPQ